MVDRIPAPTRPLRSGEQMLSANEVCRIYALDRKIVYEDIKSGRLPAQNRSHGKQPRWRIHPDSAFRLYGGAA